MAFPENVPIPFYTVGRPREPAEHASKTNTSPLKFVTDQMTKSRAIDRRAKRAHRVTSEFILGVSAFYHDSAACLLRSGEIVAAAQEERFTRRKGDHFFPSRAIGYCLAAGGIGVDDLAAVAYYDNRC